MSIGKVFSGDDLMDLGTYLQGLLQVMAADENLHERQKERIREFGESMGFEKKYIQNVIDSVLEKLHMPRKPARFHSRETARSFLIEAAHIAVCDGLLHPREKAWLLECALINEIDPAVITEILDSVPHGGDPELPLV